MCPIFPQFLHCILGPVIGLVICLPFVFLLKFATCASILSIFLVNSSFSSSFTSFFIFCSVHIAFMNTFLKLVALPSVFQLSKLLFGNVLNHFKASPLR